MEQGFVYKVGEKSKVNPTVPEEKYVIWHIKGGLGKNIAATALVKDIKEKYNDRKFILVCSWPEVFLNNPNIDRVYQLGQTPYFYENYIENKDVIVFKHEPYYQTGHITRKNHIIQSWCELLGLEYKNQKPVIIPNYVQKMTKGMWTRNKPIMVIQTGGGPFDPKQGLYSWTRDMPVEVAQEVIKKFNNQYHIIQVTRPGGYELEGVERVENKLSNMELVALLVMSQKRVLIDSCLQHAAAALDLPSTVLWIGTSPNNFGYNLHKNIVAKLPKKGSQLIGSYIFDYQFQNNLHECPYMDINEIFNVNQILASI